MRAVLGHDTDYNQTHSHTWQRNVWSIAWCASGTGSCLLSQAEWKKFGGGGGCVGPAGH